MWSLLIVLFLSSRSGLFLDAPSLLVGLISEVSTVALISGSLAVALVLLRQQPRLVAIAVAMAAASTVLISAVLLQGVALNPLVLGVPALGWVIVPTMLFRAVEYGALGWLLARVRRRTWQLCALLGVGVGMCLGSGFLLVVLVLGGAPSLGLLVGLCCHEMLLPMGCGAAAGGAIGKPRRR